MKFIALENRIVFDGALGTELFLDDGSSDTVDLAIDATPPSENEARVEVALVDTSVVDYQTLVESIPGDFHVILIDPSEAGLETALLELQGQPQIDAVHVFGHGAPGLIRIGADVITSATIADYQADLDALGQRLAPDGDILFYNCDVASTAEGVSLVQALAAYTDADVAASDDLTGSELLGGDWDLEYAIGDIDADALAAESYEHLLVSKTDTKSITLSGLGNGSGSEGGSGWSGYDVDPFTQTFYATDFGSYDIVNSVSHVSFTTNRSDFYIYEVYVDGTRIYRDATSTGITSGAWNISEPVSKSSFKVEVKVAYKNASTTRSSTGSITVTADVVTSNAAPVMTNQSSTTIAENSSTSTTVVDYNATDANGDSLSWSISGTDSSYFNINSSTGVVTFKSSPNYEAKSRYDFTVSVSDGQASDSDAFTVYISDVNERPTGANKTITIPEDSPTLLIASDFGFSDVDSGDALAKVKITSLETVGALEYYNGAAWVDVTLNQEIARADIDAGYLRYTPALNDSGAGADSFGFAVSDGSLYSASSYTANYNINALNDRTVINLGAFEEIDGSNASGVAFMPNLTLTDPDGGFSTVAVSISNHATGDLLSFTNDSATNFGNISASYSSGVLTLTSSGGSATVTQWQNALRAVEFSTTSTVAVDRSVTVTVGSGLDGHFYEAVNVKTDSRVTGYSSGVTWAQGKTVAESLTYNGLQGYLATITSSAEQTAIDNLGNFEGWIGATDSDSEGTWKWMTGPEASTVFFIDTGSSGEAQNGLYAGNWGSPQPDNYVGVEDYALFKADATWNDGSGTHASDYIFVEYGGAMTASQSLVVNDAPELLSSTTAADFDTRTKYISVTDSADALDLQNHTMSFWIKPDGATSDWQFLAGKTDATGSSTARNFTLWLRPNETRLHYSITLNGTNTTLDSTNGLTAGAWNHVAVTYDSGSMKIYINGTEDASRAASGVVATSNSSVLYMGHPPSNSSSGFAGQLAELQIYSDALTAAEISAVKDVKLTGSEDNLVYYTRFDLDGDGKVVDETVNAQLGVLSHSSVTSQDLTTYAHTHTTAILPQSQDASILVSDIVSNAPSTSLGLPDEAIVDSPSSTSEAIYISSVSAGGTWHYSTDGGTSWTQVSIPANKGLVLRGTDKLSFRPTDPNGATGTFTFGAWDQSTGTAGSYETITTTGGISAFSSATATASVTVRKQTNIAQDSTAWVNLLVGDQYDYINDTQAKSIGVDLVGDATNPLLSMQYNSTANELAFRIRQETANPNSTFYLLGVDGTQDGKIDFFIGVDVPKNGSDPTVKFYDAGNGANDAPSTTSFDTKTAVSATNAVVEIQEITGSNLDVEAGEKDGGDDAYVAFKFDAASFETYVQGLTGLSGYTLSSAVSYVLVTATQTNSINGDIGGVDGNTSQTWSSLGILQPISFTNTAPVMSADPSAKSTDENVELVFGSTDFSDSKYSDADSDAFDSIKVASLPAHGDLLYLNGSSWEYVTVGQVISVADIDANKFKFVPDDRDANYSVTFDFYVGDGTAYSSETSQFTINVTNVNAAPVISNVHGDVQYWSKSGVKVVLDPAVFGVVSDADNTDFASGVLTITVTGGTAADNELSVVDDASTHSLVTVSGSDVEYDGVAIGTISGADTDELTITFNSSATQQKITSVLTAIRFQYVGTEFIADPRTVTLEITDGDGGTSNTATMTMVGPPIYEVDGIEDTTLSFNGDSFGIGASDSLRITRMNNSNGTWYYLNSGTVTEITGTAISGGLTLTSAHFDTITYVPNSNVYGTGVDSLSYKTEGTANSVGYDSSGLSYIQPTLIVNLAAVNDAPVVDLNGTSSGTDTFTTFTEIVGADEAYNDVRLVTQRVTNLSDVDSTTLQSMTISGPFYDGDQLSLGGVTFDLSVAGSGTDFYGSFDYTLQTYVSNSVPQFTLRISHTAALSDYDALLDTLTYNNSSDTPSTTARAYSISVNDGALDSVVAVANVSVVANNDVPTLANVEASSQYDWGLDNPTAILPSVTLQDLDGEVTSVVMTISSPQSGDELLFTDTAKIEGSFASGVLTLSAVSGQVPTTAEFQAAARSVTYRNLSATADSTRSIDVVISDAAGATSGTGTTVVSLVNNTPAIDLVDSSDTGVSNTDNVTGDDTPTFSIVVPSNLSSAGGTLYLYDANGTLLETISVSVGDTTKSVTLSALADGQHTFIVKAGTFSSNVPQAEITITVDTAGPSFAAQTFAYEENSTTSDVIGTLTVSDLNGLDAFTLNSVNSATTLNGYFSLSSAGQITLTSTGAGSVSTNDYETSPNQFVLNVTVEDVAGNTTTQNVTLNVVNADEAAPTFSAQTATYNENQLGDAVVATLSASDDIGVATYRFDVTGTQTSADGYFTVDSAGKVRITANGAAAAVNDYEVGSTSFTYDIDALDAAGNSTTATLTLTVADVNEAPVLDAPLNVEVVDQATGAASAANNIGNLSSYDQDADTVTYSIVGGTLGGSTYTLAGTYGTLTVHKDTGAYTYTPSDSAVNALDAGDAATDTFQLRASDGTLSNEKALVVNVLGANDTPTASVSGTTTVSESNSANTTATATVALSDSDGSASTSFNTTYLTDNSWTHAGGNVYTLAGTYGAVSLDISNGELTYTLDYDDPDTDALDAGDTVTETFTVQGTDGAATVLQSVTFSISGTNDAPTLTVQDSVEFTLDGTNDYLDLGDVDIEGAFTLEAWVYVDDYDKTSVGRSRFFDLGEAGSSNDNIIFGYFGSTGRVALEVYNGSTGTSVQTTTVLPEGKWVHVAAVNNGDGSAAIYFNGISQTLTGDTSSLYAAADVLRADSFAGKSNWTIDDYFDGKMRDLRIWNDARSATEIFENFSKDLTNAQLADANLIASYTSNEVASTTVSNDATGANKGSDATLSNGALASTHSSTATSRDLLEEGGSVNNVTLGINTATVRLTFADVDASSSVSYVTSAYTDNGDGTYTIATGTYGSAVLDTSAHTLTYSLDNFDADTDGLDAGEAVSDAFQIKVNDGSADSNTVTVTFNISGADDAAVITPITSGAVADAADDSSNLTVSNLSGTVTVTDVDAGTNTITLYVDGATEISQTINSVVYNRQKAGNYGTFYFHDANKHYLYVPTEASVDVLRRAQSDIDAIEFVVRENVSVSDTSNWVDTLDSDAAFTQTIDITSPSYGTALWFDYTEAPQKTFTTGNKASYLEFDLYALDSWDGAEAVKAYVNGTEVFSLNRTSAAAVTSALTGTVSIGGKDVTYTVTPTSDYNSFTTSPSLNSNNWKDQSFHVVFEIPDNFGNTFDLKLGLTTNQVETDESAAVNNFELYHLAGSLPFVVDLTGANETVVLDATSQPGAVAEATDASQQNLSALTGSFAVSETDIGDTITATVVGSPIVKLNGGVMTSGYPAGLVANGVFTLSNGTQTSVDGSEAAVGWSYDPGAVDLDFLNDGDTLTVTYQVKVSDGTSDSATRDVIISISGANDAPVLSSLSTISYTDSASDDTFDIANGVFSSTDRDRSRPTTFSVSGASADTSVAGFTHSVQGTYGVLYYNSGSGAYRFVPDDGAMEGLMSNASEDFTVTVSDGIASDSGSLSVSVTATNDTAIARDDAKSLQEGVTVWGNVLINDRDRDFGSTSFEINATATNEYFQLGDVTDVFEGATALDVTLDLKSTATQTSNDVMLLSYADASSHNKLLVYIEPDAVGTTDKGVVTVIVNGVSYYTYAFDGVQVLDNNDRSVRVTWDGLTGGVAVYLNGSGGAATLDPNDVAATTDNTEFGTGVLVLGQDQDATGGGFSSNQVYRGEIKGLSISKNSGTAETFDFTTISGGRVTGSGGSNQFVRLSDDPMSVTQVVKGANTTSVNSDGTAATIAGAYGTLTVYDNGLYKYVAGTSLNDNQTETDTFTYTLTDAGSGTQTADLSFTVTGDANKPALSATTLDISVSDTPVDDTYGNVSGRLIASDPDAADTARFSVGSGALAASGVTATNFDGAGDFITATGPSYSADYTLEAWFKVDALRAGANGYQDIIAWTDGTNSNHNIQLRITPDGELEYGMTKTAFVSANTIKSNVNPTVGQWMHAAVSVSETSGTSTATMYLNGKAVGSKATTDNGLTLSQLVIGSLQDFGSGSYPFDFDGAIRDVRIWSDARTQTEISSSMFGYVASDAANLVANYKLDETAGTTAANAVSGGASGTLTGTTFDVTTISAGDSAFATSSGVKVNYVKSGSYGDLYLNSVTGEYIYVSDDASTEGLTSAVSETFSLSVTDSTAKADTKIVTLSIDAQNDTPAFSIAAGDAVSASLTEADAGLSAFDTLTIGDLEQGQTVDIAVQSVTASGSIAGLTLTNAQLKALLTLSADSTDGTDGTWSSSLVDILNASETSDQFYWKFNSGSEAFDYLATGETLTLTYTLRATDDFTAPASDDQLITIVITGTDDALEITNASLGTYTDTAGFDTSSTITQTSGVISGIDPDNSISATYVIVSGGSEVASKVGTHGTLYLNSSTGAYTYTPDVDAINAENDSDTRDTFKIRVKNGGVNYDKDLDIIINGVNDNPLFAVIDGEAQAPESGELISTYEITEGPSATALTYSGSPIEVGLYYQNTYSSSFLDFFYNFYENDASGDFTATKITTDFDGTAPTAQLLIMFQPRDAFTATELETMSNFLDAGGRIFFIGEYDRYRPIANQNISNAVTALGGNITVLGGAYVDYYADNTGSVKNLNNSPLLAGVDMFSYNYHAQLQIDSSISQAVITDDNNRIVMADQALSKGRITVFADQNWLDEGRWYGMDGSSGGVSADNDVFLRNLAINSATNIATVTGGGNPNAEFETSSNLVETNSTLNSSGSMSVTDVDVNGDNSSDEVSVSVSSISASIGGTSFAITDYISQSDLLSMLTVSPGDPDTSLDDNSGVAGTSIVATNRNSNGLNWSFDTDVGTPNDGIEAFNFIDAGETLTLQYTLTASDGQGGSATQTLDILIDGTNDTPVISSITSGVIVDAADTTGDQSGGTETGLSGTLSVSDPDRSDTSFTHAITKLNGAAVTQGSSSETGYDKKYTGLYGTLHIEEATGDYIYIPDAAAIDKLAASDTVSDVFTVTATDAAGAVAEQTYTVGITGANDIVSLTDTTDPAAITEAGNARAQDISAQTGTFAVADIDIGDTLTASVVGSPTVQLSTDSGSTFTTITTGYPSELVAGSAFSISPTSQTSVDGSETAITWTYDPAAADLDFLDAGDVLTITYKVKVNDGTSDSTEQDVTITINGSNDAPVIFTRLKSFGGVQILENDAANRTASGNYNVSDSDGSSTFTTSVSSVTVSSNSTAPSGTISALPNNAALKAMMTTNDSGNGFTWSFDSGSETFDALAAGETFVLDYVVAVSDTTATANQTITIVVTGTNDAVTVASIVANGTGDVYNNADNVNNKIESNANNAGSTQYIETGSVTYANPDLSDTVSVRENLKSISYSQRGAVATLTAAQQSALVDAFVTTLDTDTKTVHWDYTVTQSDISFLGAAETVTLTMEIVVDDGAGSTAAHDVEIQLVGKNNAPALAAKSLNSDTVTISETDAAINQAIGSAITVADANRFDLVSGEIVSGTFKRSGNAATAEALRNMTSGELSWLSLVDSTLLDRTSVSDDVSLVFNSGSETFDYLDSSETIELKYTIRATDDVPSNSLNDTRILTIVIQGTNDAPVAVADTSSTNENVPVSIDATENDTDNDASDPRSVFAKSNPAILAKIKPIDYAGTTPTTNSSVALSGNQLTFNPGDEFKYLRAGQTAKVLVNYDVSDNESTPASSTGQIEFTVVGVNDAPVISAAASALAKTKNADDAAYTVTDTLTVDDADTYDEVTATVHSVTVNGGTAGRSNAHFLQMMNVSQGAVVSSQATSGSIGWSFDSGSDDFDYVSDGDTLVLEYTIRAQDNSSAQGYADKTVTITINGKNNAPVAVNDTGSVQENGVHDIDVTSNDIDVDINDSALTPKSVGAITSSHNSSDYNSSRVTQSASASIASNKVQINLGDEFDYLSDGETASLTVDYDVEDAAGLTSTATLQLTIVGSNDAPQVSAVVANGDADAALIAETDALLAASGTLTVTDIDTSNSATVRVNGVAVVQKNSSGVAMTKGAGAPIDAHLLQMMRVPSNAIVAPAQQSNGFIWNFDSAGVAGTTLGGTFDYLALGEKLEISYEVEAVDDATTPLGGTKTVVVTIEGANDAPTFTSLTSNFLTPMGVPFSYATGSAFSDVDETDAFTFSASGLPRGLTINSTTGQISGSALTSGIFNIVVTGTDRQGASVNSNAIEILIPAPPAPPTPPAQSGPTELPAEVASPDKFTPQVTTRTSQNSLATDAAGGDAARSIAAQPANPLAVSGRSTASLPAVDTPALSQALPQQRTLNVNVSAAIESNIRGGVEVSQSVPEVEARLSDGRALPDWIVFDSDTQTFIATVPEGVSGVLEAVVILHGTNGAEVVIPVDLDLDNLSGTTAPNDAEQSQSRNGAVDDDGALLDWDELEMELLKRKAPIDFAQTSFGFNQRLAQL